MKCKFGNKTLTTKFEPLQKVWRIQNWDYMGLIPQWNVKSEYIAEIRFNVQEAGIRYEYFIANLSLGERPTFNEADLFETEAEAKAEAEKRRNKWTNEYLPTSHSTKKCK